MTVRVCFGKSAHFPWSIQLGTYSRMPDLQLVGGNERSSFARKRHKSPCPEVVTVLVEVDFSSGFSHTLRRNRGGVVGWLDIVPKKYMRDSSLEAIPSNRTPVVRWAACVHLSPFSCDVRRHMRRHSGDYAKFGQPGDAGSFPKQVGCYRPSGSSFEGTASCCH